MGTNGGATAGPLVVTITVNGAAAPLASDTVEGAWQVALGGAPAQESETLPLKPAPGVS